MRREKDGKLVEAKSELLDGLSVFGSHAFADDRGRYEMTGTAPGEYVVRASLPSMKVSVSGLLGGAGASIGAMSNSGGELEVYSGNVFRGKDAKAIRVGRGDQTGGADITIPLDGLHRLEGTVVAKRDGHPLGTAHVQLLYADDGVEVRTTEVQDASGSFAFSYVPNGQYILRVSHGEDVEPVEFHKFNSNWTEDKVTQRYGQAEMAVAVQDDVIGMELQVPMAAAATTPKP